MTTSSSEQVALAPSHRYLLDLLQRKLLQNIELYARLNSDRNSGLGDKSCIEAELIRLRGKIKRISARQRRYTLEIINGNSTNTIPKESFFQALGLVTREALSKLNSKSSERRRRTTANPRFSHEAVQARRLAIEPIASRRETKARKSRKEPIKEQETSLNDLKKLIEAKVRLIQLKKASNTKLQEENDHIKKLSLGIIDALKMILDR